MMLLSGLVGGLAPKARNPPITSGGSRRGACHRAALFADPLAADPPTKLRPPSADELLQLVDRAFPAVAVAVARLVVEELLVGERQERAVAVGLEIDGDQRLALRRALPGPGEHQFPVRHELPIDAADVVIFAARRAHQPAIAAA